MKFDELYKLEDRDYFEPMAISVDDKNRRRELADLLTDVFLYFFSVYEVHLMHNTLLEKALYEQLLADKISDAVSKVTGIDSDMSKHIRALAKEVVDTTSKHVDAKVQVRQTPQNSDNTFTALDNAHEPLELETEAESNSPFPDSNPTSGSHFQDDNVDKAINEDEDEVEEIMEREAVSEYWLSIARAILIARNEANTFLNYTDFMDAKNSGKTKKTWWAMPDNKVRETHEEVEGQTIGIDEYFQVGNSEMRFPHDWELMPDPQEVINCRCAVEYK